MESAISLYKMWYLTFLLCGAVLGQQAGKISGVRATADGIFFSLKNQL